MEWKYKDQMCEEIRPILVGGNPIITIEEYAEWLQDKCGEMKEENARLRKALENSHRWLMRICKSDISKNALEMCETGTELSYNIQALTEKEEGK